MAAYSASGTADRVYSLVACAAQEPEIRDAVEANHDDNRWWPLSVSDWRVRMTVAGWSTRVSYAMINTYADVVAQADSLGWGGLTRLDDANSARWSARSAWQRLASVTSAHSRPSSAMPTLQELILPG